MTYHAGSYQWRVGLTTGGETVKMAMSLSGAVAIGNNAAPNENYKLIVDGKIGAREIMVAAGSWPDFVLKKNYTLPSLNAVESHIKKTGSLPGVPSEKKVLAKGVNVGQMEATLLQKVEELTLYVIEQQKEIDNLKSSLRDLRKND